MLCARGEIACRYEPTRSDLTLKCEVPRVSMRRRQIRLVGNKQSGRQKWRICIEDIRKRISDASPRCIETARRTLNRNPAAPRNGTRRHFTPDSREKCKTVSILG